MSEVYLSFKVHGQTDDFKFKNYDSTRIIFTALLSCWVIRVDQSSDSINRSRFTQLFSRVKSVVSLDGITDLIIEGSI